MHTGPYICGIAHLTCILAALNNYSGYDVFTVNPLVRPTKHSDFVSFFADLTGGDLVLIGIPGQIFHALYLGGIDIPNHIFAIRGAHIFNYVYHNYYWWHVDSKYQIHEKIHVGLIGLRDDLLYLPYAKSDVANICTQIREWKIPRENDYYMDIRARLLKSLTEQ